MNTKLCLFGILVSLQTLCATLIAATGPDPVTWVSNYGAVGTTTATIGSLSVRYQTSALSARDVGRLFVSAISGTNIQVLASGSGGAVVDVFDEARDNGQYAIFGSAKSGTLTLTFQTQPAAGGAWTTQGTLSFSVGAARVLKHDTDIGISSWYMCPPAYNAQTITQAQFTSALDTDFSSMQSNGFNKVQMCWRPVNYPSVLFSKASQYNLQVMFSLWRTNDYIEGNSPHVSGSHNQPLLEMESKIIADGINSDVGGGVLMKNHPNLASYYLDDEPPASVARAVELAAMVTKSLDPNHTGACVFAGTTADVLSLISATPFLDIQMIDPYPLGNTNALNRAGANPSAASDFRYHYPFTNATYHPAMTWPDYIQWVQSQRPGVPVDLLFQAFGSDPAVIYWREPSPKEVRAQAFIGLARGVRTLHYFTYNSEIGGEGLAGLIDTSGNATAKLTEAADINAKIANWIPTYRRLAISSSPSNAYIPYANVGPFTDTFYTKGFESTTGTAGTSGFNGAIVPTKACAAHSGSWAGLAGASAGSNTFSENININWVRFPRYSSATIGGWVNDNNNASMTHRFGAAFSVLGGGWNNNPGNYTAIGTGWNYLSTDLSSRVSSSTILGTPLLYFGSYSTGSYVDHYIDDITFTATIAAYRPNYQYQGGVVGNFIHKDTGKQYIILVNTDAENSRNVSVNVTGTSGSAAGTAQDFDSGAVYQLSNGVLTVTLPAGDGKLIAIDP